MSRVQSLFVRVAVLYLVATGVLGLTFLITSQWTWAFRVTHVHMGVLGFFLSLVMGVAFWLLPRPGGRRTPRVEALAFGLFHGGLLLRTVIEPWSKLGGPAFLPPLLVCAGASTLLGIAVFARSVWGRAVSVEELRRARSEPRP